MPDPTHEADIVVPLVKWAGGKRWLYQRHPDVIPTNYNRYIEPFFGGGAFFFRVLPKAALISDSNYDLIETYISVRENWKLVVRYLREHAAKHSSEHYYAVRKHRPKSGAKRAARFLYLNRTCWNGLYRVNKFGVFNVPKGTKDQVFLPTDDFEAASLALSSAEIVCCDFEESIDKAEAGDFVFADPPYTVRHNFNGFVKYNQKLFSWDDQVRLKAACVRAVNRGARVLITNADHDSIRELYCDFPRQKAVERTSVLSGDPAYRGKTTELLISAGGVE